MTTPISRRTLLGAGLTTAGLALASPSSIAGPRPRRVLVATNEPWGTYHVKPLLAEASRRGWQVTQVVPDLTQITPGDPVPVTTLADRPTADLLVLNGAEDWPAEVAAALPHLPVVASSLAYLRPQESPNAAAIRPRIVAMTASGRAEADVFAAYWGWPGTVRKVGSAQTDALPTYRPVTDRVLVLTSVTKSSSTGGSAPGAQLLLDSAAALAAAGQHIVVGLHPREDPTLWDDYEISALGSVVESATAARAIGIPGSVFPIIAAVGCPLVGVTDPALTVPDYVLQVCSSTIASADEAVSAVASAGPAPRGAVMDAVGPISHSAQRLFSVWGAAVRRA